MLQCPYRLIDPPQASVHGRSSHSRGAAGGHSTTLAPVRPPALGGEHACQPLSEFDVSLRGEVLLPRRVLDKVLRVRQIARPLRQSTARPSLQRFEMSGEETFNGILVSGPSQIDEMKCRFRIIDAGVRCGALSGFAVHDVIRNELSNKA